jgi:hypothetical protein
MGLTPEHDPADGLQVTEVSTEVVMEIVALSSAPLALFLVHAALRSDLARAIAPSLFALTVGSLVLAYLGAKEGQLLSVVAASVGAAIAGAGLVTVILTIDARLAAKGTANAGPTALRPALAIGGARRWREFEQHFWAHVDAYDWATARLSGGPFAHQPQGAPAPDGDGGARRAVAEALYAFQRQGRAALFVFLRRDATGRVLEAAAYDPEDYL